MRRALHVVQRFFSGAPQSRDPSRNNWWTPDQQRTAEEALRSIRGTP